MRTDKSVINQQERAKLDITLSVCDVLLKSYNAKPLIFAAEISQTERRKAAIVKRLAALEAAEANNGG